MVLDESILVGFVLDGDGNGSKRLANKGQRADVDDELRPADKAKTMNAILDIQLVITALHHVTTARWRHNSEFEPEP